MKKIILLFIILFLAGSVLAVELPADYYGTAKLNDQFANGAIVSAYINGQLKDSAVVGELVIDYYLVHIEGQAGDLITFKIDGNPTNQTATWAEGSHRLDLVAATGLNNDQPPSDGGGGGGGGGGGRFEEDEEAQFNNTPPFRTSTPEENLESLSREENLLQLGSKNQNNQQTNTGLIQNLFNMITGAAVGPTNTAVNALDVAALVIIVGLGITSSIFLTRKKKRRLNATNINPTNIS